MEDLYHLISIYFIEPLGMFLGIIGVIIITIGCLKGLTAYFQKKDFDEIRWIIAAHVILGLDFLVGRDIIDTLLLDGLDDHEFWKALISLTVIVTIRIILTYFTEKELRELQASNKI